jgi:ubiquinol-cytochrome c reductase cytochrome b subunit
MAMGLATLLLFFLPWLDRSPVKSIRYKGPITQAAIALFVAAFFVLGYLGTQPVTSGRTLSAQIGTAVYFLFFFLMPWWSKMDKVRPEPRRVTGK